MNAPSFSAASVARAALPPGEEAISILIVDDEPKNLTVLEAVLEDPAYRLVRAESADEALLALMSGEFALLILDIRMPGMSGLELAHMIKARKRTARVPIIFLTAYYNEDQHVLDGYDSGAVDYLQKPVNAAVLRSKVAVFADLHRMTRELLEYNNALLSEVGERRRAEEQLADLNRTLEQRVTERTRALYASDTRLRLAADAVGLGIWSCRPDTSQMVWENDWPHRVLGLPSAEKTQTLEDYAALYVQREDYAHFRAALSATLRGEGQLACEAQLRRPNGALCWVEFVGKSTAGSEGDENQVLGTARDITERKHTEVALREADARKDIFLATLGHELRNPLAPIRNAAQLLEMPGLSPARVQACRAIIARQVRHMTTLVDDLLDMSRVSRGIFDLKKSWIELRKVVEEAIESTQPLMSARGHHLCIEAGPGDMCVNADPLRLLQVLVNLLANAAKFSEDGGTITLAVALEAQELVLSVRDNGIGIAPAMLERIFDMFAQGSAAPGRAASGLGIGLALAKGIVEMHGGRIEVRSAGLGRGSEFSVRLPRSCVRQATGSADVVTGAMRGAQSVITRRVLVADDNRDAADSLALLLECSGHRVWRAFSGHEALSVALREQPEVLILDIGMPGLNGYEVAERVRAEPWGKRAALLAVTGWGQERDRQLSRAAGFDRHLTKPVGLELLEAFMAQLVTTPSSAEGATAFSDPPAKL
jgi:PAS domain S-box-containing protein